MATYFLSLALVIAILLGVPLWAIVDAARRPRPVWEAAGRSRNAWVYGLAFGAILGWGLIASLVYVLGPRPSLKRAERAGIPRQV